MTLDYLYGDFTVSHFSESAASNQILYGTGMHPGFPVTPVLG